MVGVASNAPARFRPVWRRERCFQREGGKRVTIGADCAGLGSALEAICSVAPDAEVEFVSEIDDKARSHLNNNFRVKTQTSDIRGRLPHQDVHVDLYVCGYPCQMSSKL